jgi:DUF4097 and DUF4098 domain-containing protein YvlB
MVLRLAFAFLLLHLSWQQTEPAQKSSGAKIPYTEKSEKEFSFYPGGKIEIAAAAPGSLTIAGWDKASVRVEMEKIFYYLSSEEAQALAKRYPIRVTYTATMARISTGGAAQPGATMENNIQVFVPRDRTDLDIKMVKGDLSLTTLRGSVEATLREGNIEARDLAGYFSLRTERGDLNVDLSGPRWIGYGLWGKTSQGSVRLQLPVVFSAALQLGTKNGKISVDYPEQLVEGESVPLKILEKKKAASVSTPIGTGGAPVNLMTLSGNIIFTGKK